MMERKLISEGGILDYDAEFLSKENADLLFSFIQNNVSWEQVFYNYGGKKVPQPRLTAWYADDVDMAYSYSGITQVVQTWLPELVELKRSIEAVSGAEYNSVLLNFYRSGRDSVGLHADDEKELGVNPNIASISLGAERTFELRHKEELIEYELTHGSLLIMSGTTQKYWKHSIPKMYNLKDGRINLTFRKFFK
jgi:alkylated DNA repair dioxygenase AlkB